MRMFALAHTPNAKQCKISNTNYENWKDYFVKENNTDDKSKHWEFQAFSFIGLTRTTYLLLT